MAIDNEKQPVDCWLDAAIKQYGNVEPISGLEQRVLRNLQARPERNMPWQKWWVLAATAAVILLVAGIFLKESERQPQKIAAMRPAPVTIAAVPKFVPSIPHATVSSKKQNKTYEQHVIKAKKQWPSQFPTPQPLSDQEKMLAQFVNQFPQQAALQARLQTQLLKQFDTNSFPEDDATQSIPDNKEPQ
jgi:hypothetical protein